MKVYLAIFHIHYESCNVEKVCSTREKAQLYIDEEVVSKKNPYRNWEQLGDGRWTSGWESYRIEEWEVE